MKLQISIKSEPSHKSAVTCVGWSGADEIFTTGDDGQLLAWNVLHNEFVKVTQLNEDVLPTDLQFLSKSSSSLGKHSDVLLITSANGRFYIANRNGRVERTVEAHKGAILVGQWSNDGVGLMTGGEDGFIKIWSRGGMLRSTMVAGDNSIYGACWSPDSQAIVYTQGNLLVIKDLAPNSLPKKWIAHDGLVLCVGWSSTDLIASGSEDGRYKVWDNQGHQLYSSGLHEHPVACVAWAPEGDLFAIGSYNTVRLCDCYGWSKSLEKPSTGCVYKLAFSHDGTQIAGSCANGHVLLAHVLDRSVVYANYVATVSERKTVTVLDLSNDAVDYLELPERVVKMEMKYSHLVATTPNQCYVYANTNWNTPNVFELKDGYVVLLILSQKLILLAEKCALGLYNYQGRLMASPRWPNMKLDALKSSMVALSSDALAVRDVGDPKTVYVLDLTSSRSNDHYVTIQHSLPVVQIALDQCGDAANRKLTMLDNARDLHLIDVKSTYRKIYRLGGQIQSFCWNSETNFLAAIQDTQLVVWYCPSACYDVNLLRLSSFTRDTFDFGKNPRIDGFVGNFVSVRRSDGALINVPISPFPAILHKCVDENKWKMARCLCRTIDDQTLWSCLAVLLITQSNNVDVLDMAEEAFAEIDYYDAVFYLQEIKQFATKAQTLAGVAQLCGNYQKAESILLQNGLIFQATLMNLNIYNWNRALDLALKHKLHVDVVMFKRRLYLEELGKDENNEAFLKITGKIPIDDDKIQQKLEAEEKKLFVS